MKKEGVLILFLIISLLIISEFIFATEEEHVLLGYSCLENKISQKTCNSMTFEEKVFSLMSVGECRDSLLSDRSSNFCWPKSSCNVKSTAQAVFALNDKKINTTLSNNWLLTQTKVTTDLQWFLEIDTYSPSNCEIEYKGGKYTLLINAERKLSSSNLGACLKINPNAYWINISSSCYNTEFHISCDSRYLTTLLFKKLDNSYTIHVLGETHSGSPYANVTEKVDALCFKDGNSCTYEGTLWATFALWTQGYDVSKFIPYLTALRDSNSRYLPEAFLFFMTGKFEGDLLFKQKQSSYWEESGDRYYDTALALWPFKYKEISEKEIAKEWLLNVQSREGCWNSGNIRDTAFILRAIWPEYAPECKVNADCRGENYICVNRTCVEKPYTPVCGNNIKESGEQCDGIDLGGQTCESIITSAWEGTLKCSSNCIINTSLCTQKPECNSNSDCSNNGSYICVNGFCVPKGNEGPVCGNNIKESNEQCDGTNLGGQTCESVFGVGYSGNLSCNSNCVLNTSSCSNKISCIFNFQCQPYNMVCEGGVCVNKTITTNCSSDFDCPGIEICEGGVCVNKSVTTNCSSDFDCPGTEICEGGVCVEPEPVCVYDSDCPEETQECIAGNCVEKGNNEMEYCMTDDDCTQGRCIDYICSDNALDCEGEGYFCMNSLDCTGRIIQMYSDSCFSPFICCSEPEYLESCSELYGEICDSGETCVGGIKKNTSGLKDGQVCCTNGGYCLSEEREECTYDSDCQQSGYICDEGFCVLNTQSLSCTDNNGVCRIGECQKNEQLSSTYSCRFGDNCCLPKKNSKSGIILLIVLLVLVLLVVLGIIFREKLKNYWIKLKSKLGKKNKFSLSNQKYPKEAHNIGLKKPSFFRRIIPFKSKHPSESVIPSSQQNLGRQHIQEQNLYEKETPSSKGIGIQQQKAPEPKKIELRKVPQIKRIEKKSPSKTKEELNEVLKKLKEMGK